MYVKEDLRQYVLLSARPMRLVQEACHLQTTVTNSIAAKVTDAHQK